MSMLSEQRRKTKWVVNPTKKPLWSTDSSGIKFGKELMEKMGWSAGKGLGLNEQGIQEPLRVSFKNDTKGMGFKGNDDNWIEHQDEFNSLLNQLRSSEDSSVVKIPEEEKREIKSLEEKSKTSKARVHYQKFTRGKDLSKYSENDLACILGTNKMKKEKPKSEEIIEMELKTDGNCETSFGVTTINSGSLQDYFKRKWIINKNKSDESNTDNIENFTENISNEKSSSYNRQNVEERKEKKPKKKRHKLESEEQLPVEANKISESDILESGDKIGKRKRKTKENEINSDNEPIKKKKKSSDSDDTVEDEISPENNPISAECGNLTYENQHLDSSPKKSKKEKNYFKSGIAHDEDKSSYVKEKKKRKKKEKNDEETSTSDIALVINGINDGEEYKSGEKKYKKEKRKKSCSKEDEPLSAQNDKIESSLNEKSTKSKNIKKSKKENSEETEESGSTHTELKEYSCSDESADKFNIGVENDENPFSKKKKKKKDKKEKSTEVDFNCSGHENKNYLALEDESNIEVESGKKKKKKKEKKEKMEENNHNNENEGCLYENSSEEPMKKKKGKKGKSSQHEDEENQTVPEEGEEESVKKKKKKKKEKLHDGNKSQQSCQVEPVEEPELRKSVTAGNADGIDSSQMENNPMSGIKTEGEKRIDKLKVNLFGDEVSEKYFPQQGPNERVLKMIKWANISEFKGSNLRDVEGYGRKLMCQRQAR